MTISLRCPACQKRLKAPPEVAGKKIKCPACSAPFVAVALPDAPPSIPALAPPSRPGEVWCMGEKGAAVIAVAFTSDGRYLLSAAGSTLYLREAATGREVRRMQAPATVNGAAVSPDGSLAASVGAKAGGRSDVVLWELATGREVRRLVGHEEDVNGVAFSPGGKSLVSGGDDGLVRVWSVATGKEKWRFEISAVIPTVYCVAYSPDGSCVAAGTFANGHDKSIWVWDVKDGERIELEKGWFDAQMGMEPGINSLAFTADGEEIIAAREDCIVQFWDIESQEFGVQFTTGGFFSSVSHTKPVTAVAVSPDGGRVASVGQDNMLRLWDTESFKEVCSFKAPTGLRSVAFSPEGDYAAAGGQDGLVRLWGLP